MRSRERRRRAESSQVDVVGVGPKVAADHVDDGDMVRQSGPRPYAWVIAACVALLVVGAIVVRARRSDHAHRAAPSPPSSSPRSSPTPTPVSASGLGYTVGDRCPGGVSCGVAERVAAGMEQSFNNRFPDASILSRTSAFDAATGRIYWQQLAATLTGGFSVTATEQRAQTSAKQAVQVDSSSDGTLRTVMIRRGQWRLTVTLVAAGPNRPDTRAATLWVTTAPLPR